MRSKRAVAVPALPGRRAAHGPPKLCTQPCTEPAIFRPTERSGSHEVWAGPGEDARIVCWGAYLPDLPGVVALGDTLEQVTAGIQEALDAYAEEMRSLGKQLPAPAATASTVQAA